MQTITDEILLVEEAIKQEQKIHCLTEMENIFSSHLV